MKKNGEPVIEQHQASRRFKRKVNTACITRLPPEIRDMRPRVNDDGTFYLSRSTKEINQALSKDFIKLPNENRWYPKTVESIPLSDIKGYFNGKECYIVGKGPSLDRLQAKDFPNPSAPIICLNEAIYKVETLDIQNKLFVLQQDAWLKQTCLPKKATTTLLLNYTCNNWYATGRDKFVFHHRDLGLNKRSISAVYAISLAKLCGSNQFKLLCFDAAMTQNTGYAKIIGYDPKTGGDPKRFLNHRLAISKAATPLPLEFIPVNLVEPSSDTQQPCKDNH